MGFPMKILAVLLSPPVPTTAGHRVRNRSILRALAQEGHEVTVASFADPDELATPAREWGGLCRAFHLVPAPLGSAMARVLSLPDVRPYGAVRLTVPAMQELVLHLLAAEKFDVILCDDCYMAGNLPAEPGIPVVMNKHDITCNIVRQFANASPNPFKRLYAGMEANKIERLEMEACRSAQAVAVCSVDDARALNDVARGLRQFVVPNVVDTDKYTPHPVGDGRSVVFVGAMDWLPNQDGADFLVFDILPRLRQLVPNARIVLAGRNPSPEFIARYEEFPDVTFTGTVVELRPILARASVCVVPLRIGSGTRLKILEAGAMGKPTVSTTLGAEGLELANGSEILLEDAPRAFAEAVAGLLLNPTRAQAIGMAARAAVEERYSIPALRRHLAYMLDKLAPSPAEAHP
jgi:glycosyltransferase involved in cell wall biosynthesis